MCRITGLSSIAAAAALAGLLLAGCAEDEAAAAQEGESAGCRHPLFTDEEIERAIGPHTGGKSALENTWGLKSCRWQAMQAQAIEGFPAGRHDAVELAVFDEDFVESWARGEADGDPIGGVADGALYDSTYGELWFDCAGGRFCVVKVDTASGEKRQERALRLAQLAVSRLP